MNTAELSWTSNTSSSIGDLVVDEYGDFRVSGRVYTDEHIFALEMKRIFSSTWIYVGHVSEVPEPGSYKSAYIGLQPVIVARDDDGNINVFLNRCRHRGAVVCRDHKGQGGTLRCLYHSWVYDCSGKLIAISQRDGYPSSFPQAELGLWKVPRVAQYRGLIFASLNATVGSLEDHLGEARRVIDDAMAISPSGSITVSDSVTRHSYLGNWKLLCENTVDGYHGNYVHRSFQETSVRSRDSEAPRQVASSENSSIRDQVAFRELGGTRGFEHGHGTLDRPVTLDRLKELSEADTSKHIERLIESVGQERTAEILAQRNLYVFPNLFFAFGPHLRVLQPRRPDLTEVIQAAYLPEGAPPDFGVKQLRRIEQFQGPAGFGTPDDLEVFHACQTGFMAEDAEWVVLTRGIQRERIDDRGVRHGHSTDETPQRALYREWRRLMSASDDAAVVGEA